MRRRLPSTQALLCFEAAARHQSFTRVAEELVLILGAVSRQVAALEEVARVALFRRTLHRMKLTEAGADYARQVGRRLDALERDTLDLRSRRGEGDRLTIASVPTFAVRCLIPRLPALERAAASAAAGAHRGAHSALPVQRHPGRCGPVRGHAKAAAAVGWHLVRAAAPRGSRAGLQAALAAQERPACSIHYVGRRSASNGALRPSMTQATGHSRRSRGGLFAWIRHGPYRLKAASSSGVVSNGSMPLFAGRAASHC